MSNANITKLHKKNKELYEMYHNIFFSQLAPIYSKKPNDALGAKMDYAESQMKKYKSRINYFNSKNGNYEQ